jgi:hypothetical protein
MNKAKEKLEFVEAELDREIRSNPVEHGLEKVTESTVKHVIIVSHTYVDAKERYINARYEYSVAKGAVTAFQHRKNALENLVTLHGQQYFSGPSVPKNISREWEREQKQARSNKKVTITPKKHRK